jgi:hypothetical protein
MYVIFSCLGLVIVFVRTSENYDIREIGSGPFRRYHCPIMGTALPVVAPSPPVQIPHNVYGVFVDDINQANASRIVQGITGAMVERGSVGQGNGVAFGMREIGVHEPSGHTVVFAARTSS